MARNIAPPDGSSRRWLGALMRMGLMPAWLFAVVLSVAPQAQADEVSSAVAVTRGGPAVYPAEFNGDLRKLPKAVGTEALRRPAYRPRLAAPPSTKFGKPTVPAEKLAPAVPVKAMPSPIQNFPGMSFSDLCGGSTCGGGWPPDPNGDAGLSHYILAVNNAYAIYNKSGSLLTSFTENQLWAGGGTPCTGNSQGDPIVVYDWIADRWILSHFAFAISGGNDVSPFYQCIAASKTSDPVSGGWWLYAVRMDPGGAGLPPVGTLNDYAKLGLWHDCLYLGANGFDSTDPMVPFVGVEFASFSRSDMYAGLPLTYSIGFLDFGSNTVFSMFPSNNQGKGANAVPPGTPAYFVSESLSLFTFEVRKFTPGPNCGAGGTLGPATNVTQTAYFFKQGAVVPQPGTANMLDMIDDRIMQKVQYRKIGAAESLWVTHPVGATSDQIAMQWAQIDVSAGNVNTTPVQQQIYAPDIGSPSTALNRFMGSLAVDRQGNMALGYTTSNATAPNFPSLGYSGRLAGDPLNTLAQGEAQLFAGSGSQTNNCGGGPCNRWGDYSSMSVDPADDCTFWYANEYYGSPTNGASGNWQTRVGSFKYPGCVSLVDLTITKTHVGNFFRSQTGATYTITVNNIGTGATDGSVVTVTDTPPPSLTPTALSGSGWACVLGTLTCTRSSTLLAGQSYPPITLTVTVAGNAPGSVTNNVQVSGGGDTNGGNNSASDPTTVTVSASTNANLSNLVLSAGTLSPPFASGTTSYTANVVSAGNTITVTPTVADANATVTVNGVPVASGTPSGPITLSVGSNPIAVVVTAQDGTPKTYNVNVTYTVGTCTYSLSPLDLSNRPKTGGATNITVTTPSGCPVSATSFQPWVVIGSIVPSGGTTTVNLSLLANGGAARATSIVVAGRLFLVTQLAGP